MYTAIVVLVLLSILLLLLLLVVVVVVVVAAVAGRVAPAEVPPELRRDGGHEDLYEECKLRIQGI